VLVLLGNSTIPRIRQHIFDALYVLNTGFELSKCNRNNTLVVLALLVGWTPKVTALLSIQPLACDRYLFADAYHIAAH
jgi:hypothetical protein